MSVTLNTYRWHLSNRKSIVEEMDHKVYPFETQFSFHKDNWDYYSEFLDPDGNKIKVLFYHLKSNTLSHEIDFMVNGSLYGDGFIKNEKQFFQIISTVIECINSFILKLNLKWLKINVVETDGVEGQYHRIWKEYVLKNIIDTGFVVCPLEKNMIILQNNR